MLQHSSGGLEEASFLTRTLEKIPSRELSAPQSPSIVSSSPGSQLERRDPSIISKKKLFLYLKRTSSHAESTNLHALRGLHDAYPTLRTTESYNLLIGYAILREKYREARYLLQEMAEAGYIPNMRTWRLRVRLYMAEGYPELAYRCAISGISWGKPRGIPRLGPTVFCVWAELLKPTGHRRTYEVKPRRKTFSLPLPAHQTASNFVLPDEQPFVPFELLFAPHILPSPESFVQMDYRAAADIVAYLRSQGKRDTAVGVTFAWVSSLPRDVTAKANLQAFHVINQNLHDHNPHLSPRAKGHTAIVQMVRRQVDLIFQLHKIRPQLRPPSLSVQQLLRALRIIRNPAIEVAVLIMRLERVWENILDFNARVVALGALLKDQAPYRLTSQVKRLIQEQDDELARRKMPLPSDPPDANFLRPRGQDVSKYLSLKSKARRLGIVRDFCTGNIQSLEAQ